ncbi:hypothetical protein T4C_8663 [Trichinella pseudospiralis]|uniref:Uncharacterized protein n=1 Tax=Trichinella pseudospiralis TaxID=6337 RepID=A0A0V1K7P8_TRIPS|nr:hypothetical protein T4C_8663 [Trichinella pseudospiralis]
MRVLMVLCWIRPRRFHNFKLSKAEKYVQLQKLSMLLQLLFFRDANVLRGQLVVFVKIRHLTAVSLTGGPELS